jgi:hypothetical protein
MSGWGEIIKQGVKSATKAMIKKGSTVSTKKIDDGVVKFVEPYSKKVTVQSKDGKITETVKGEEVRVKPIKTRTKNESVYIADEADVPKRIDEFSENQLSTMSDGEIRQRLVNSDLESYSDLARIAPGDSAIMKRVRAIGQAKVPGLRKTSEELAYKKNIFTREREQAAKELADKKVVKEQQAKKERAKAQADLEKSQARRNKPQINSPGIDGDSMKLIQAFQRWRDTGKWAKGGSVNTKKKQYRTVTNRFSDRMLPNKKRTTRIY